MRIANVAGFLLLCLDGSAALAAPVGSLYVHQNSGSQGGYSGNSWELADDFVIPVGETWRITGVRFNGVATPNDNYTISFYGNASGPGEPGGLLCTRQAPARSTDVQFGWYYNPEYRLSAPCVLAAGTYWVSLRTPIDSQVSNTANVVGNQARMRVPGGSSCVTWTSTFSCVGSARDLQFTIFGCIGATCEFVLASNATCTGNDMAVAINNGDGAFDVSGSGPGLPRGSVGEGTQLFTGPAIWQSVAVTELGGDTQSQSFGIVNCGPKSATFVQSDGTTQVDEFSPAATDSYTIVLDSSPNPGETVTVTPMSNTTTGVTTSPASLVFTDADWNVARTITVSVVDDILFDPPPHTDTITHELTTTGGAWDFVGIGSVTVDIIDNDIFLLKDGFEN